MAKRIYIANDGELPKGLKNELQELIEIFWLTKKDTFADIVSCEEWQKKHVEYKEKSVHALAESAVMEFGVFSTYFLKKRGIEDPLKYLEEFQSLFLHTKKRFTEIWHEVEEEE